MAFYHFVSNLFPLKSLIKELIDNLVIDSDNIEFTSIYTVYKDNNGAIVVTTATMMTPTSTHIYVKYHWFRQYVGKESVIRKINIENQEADIFTKGLQSELFVRTRNLQCSWKSFRQEGVYQEMSSSALNGDIMAQKGIFWTIREPYYLSLICHYILSEEKGL